MSIFSTIIFASIKDCGSSSFIRKSENVLAIEAAVFSKFHVIALVIFVLAIIHTFLTHKIRELADLVDKRYKKKLRKEKEPLQLRGRKKVSFLAETLFFLGEVEVVFGIWAFPLFINIALNFDWFSAIEYINSRDYSEPLYVVVIMILASTRPIVLLAEKILHRLSIFLGDSVTAWWFVILSIGPITGSFFTEPAAMVLCCLLLSRQFYAYHPSKGLSYATLGLLFVNVSVGGVLTNFAAPPVLVVAQCWGLTSWYMFKTFGIIAIAGVLICNFIYWHFYRSEFKILNKKKKQDPISLPKNDSVPIWITLIHILLLFWMVMNAHYPAVIIATLLLFLGFHRATHHFQDAMYLKRPFLVGAFLAGLVIHGDLQSWWVSAVLENFKALSLMVLGVILSAFIENAAVTYLTSLTPGLTESFKYAIISAAVTGGGLTVIAHSANPVGQALLEKHFKQGIAPLYLFFAALVPTIIFFILYYIPFLVNGF